MKGETDCTITYQLLDSKLVLIASTFFKFFFLNPQRTKRQKILVWNLKTLLKGKECTLNYNFWSTEFCIQIKASRHLV